MTTSAFRGMLVSSAFVRAEPATKWLPDWHGGCLFWCGSGPSRHLYPTTDSAKKQADPLQGRAAGL